MRGGGARTGNWPMGAARVTLHCSFGFQRRHRAAVISVRASDPCGCVIFSLLHFNLCFRRERLVRTGLRLFSINAPSHVIFRRRLNAAASVHPVWSCSIVYRKESRRSNAVTRPITGRVGQFARKKAVIVEEMQLLAGTSSNPKQRSSSNRAIFGSTPLRWNLNKRRSMAGKEIRSTTSRRR